MASNIVPTDVNGVGAEAHLLTKLVLDENGNPPPFEVLEAEFGGDMQAFLVLLEHNLVKRAATPRPRGYPPRVFISYRRESPEHIAWCLRLADALERLGYSPLLDERAYHANSPEELAFFISTLIDADLCLVVTTESYLGDGKSMRNWLFEEWERIRMLDRWGSTEVVLVHRGGALPNLMGAGSIPLRWGVLDLSEEPDGIETVANYFGEYSGLRLSAEDERELAGVLAPILKSLATEHVAAADVAAAWRTLTDLGHWSDTEEYRLARVMVLIKSGETEAALAAARELLEGVVTIPTAGWLLIQLWIADLELRVFPLIAELSEEPSLWRNSLHGVMGATLLDLGASVSAANHYSWCIGAFADEALGARWSWSKGPALVAAQQQEAIWGNLGQPALADLNATIAAGLGREGDDNRWLLPLWHESLQHLSKLGPLCSRCGSLFTAPKVCIRCGVDLGSEAHHCPLCEFPTGEFLTLGFCPVCRKTAQGDNVLFNEREPGGRWSLVRRRTTEELNARRYSTAWKDPRDLGL